MKRKILIVILGILIGGIFLVIGGGIWAYSNGYYHALRGGIAQGNNDLDKAIIYFKTAYKKNPEAFMVAHDLACCYALKGDNESCFYWLRLALKTRYANYAKKWAKTEHDFDSVRQTKEFQSLIYDSPKTKAD
jgi:tetratricopeptide (TPR) repeat protein